MVYSFWAFLLPFCALLQKKPVLGKSVFKDAGFRSITSRSEEMDMAAYTREAPTGWKYKVRSLLDGTKNLSFVVSIEKKRGKTLFSSIDTSIFPLSFCTSNIPAGMQNPPVQYVFSSFVSTGNEETDSFS